MITQQELDALLLVLQRAPMNALEIMAVNAIVEKLANATKAANATSSDGTPGGDDAATYAAAPAD